MLRINEIINLQKKMLEEVKKLTEEKGFTLERQRKEIERVKH